MDLTFGRGYTAGNYTKAVHGGITIRGLLNVKTGNLLDGPSLTVGTLMMQSQKVKEFEDLKLPAPNLKHEGDAFQENNNLWWLRKRPE